ncbi:MAG TPA: MFS transporter [Candidatus Acidoferrales bacterium]|nr:MFS transporter [Candidatus Acidoferrales bacterium]
MATTDLKIDNPLRPTVSSWQAWWPVVMMMGCSFLSYFDRQILAVLSPMILSDLKLNAEKYSQIISAFSVAYMLGNPIWGAVLDRIGLRRGMTLSVSIWTIACGAHAMLAGFLGFAVARAVLGFGEGATFPGGLRAAMDWLPPQKQSRGIAVAYSGGSLGAILTPVVITPVAIAYGWRAAFIVTGIAGLLWVIVWRRTVNFSLVASSRQAQTIILPDLFERRFWSLVSSYALGALPLGLILYLAPLYLAQVLGFTQSSLGRILWIPPLGWEIGYFFWGWFADRFAAANRRPAWLIFLLALLSLPFLGVTASLNPAIVLGLMFWSTFISSGFVIVALRTSALAYPREQTALVAGIGAGSWSAFVAIVLPILGRMFDAGHYTTAFVFVGVIPLFGAFFWWLLTMPNAASAPPASSAS